MWVSFVGLFCVVKGLFCRSLFVGLICRSLLCCEGSLLQFSCVGLFCRSLLCCGRVSFVGLLCGSLL